MSMARCLRPQPESLAVYELRERHELPLINCTTCLKDVWLRGRWLQRCNFLLHRFRRVIGLSLALGCLPMWMSGFVPAPIGRWLGLAALLLQSVPLIATSIVLRYDMVCLLMRTYDFWYFTLINLATAVFGCLKYGDIRGAVPLLSFIGYQQMLLIDANHRGTKNTIVLSVVSGVTLMAYAMYVAFDLIDDAHTTVVFRQRGWMVEGGDIIVNSLVNIIVMLLRNAYRKHETMRKAGDRVDRRIVPCITYYCRTRLVPVNTIRTESVISMDAVMLSKLRMVHPNQLFQDADVISNSAFTLLHTFLRRPGLVRWSYRVFSSISIALSIVAVLNPQRRALGVAAMVMSGTHSLCLLTLCQKQLLRKLLWSFEFWFISVQASLLVWSIGYLQHWDSRSLGVSCGWLWSHWVLFLDALTPSTKASLGLPNRLPSLVLVLLLCAQLLIAVDLVFWETWQLDDRVLFTVRLWGHSLHLSVASFLMSRNFSVFCWCCRLLWRLETRVENELLLIQGALEYDDLARQRSRERWKAIQTKMNAVIPLARPQSATTTSGSKGSEGGLPNAAELNDCK